MRDFSLKQGTASPQDEPGRELLLEPKPKMPRARTRAPSPSAKAGTRPWNSLGASPPIPLTPREFGPNLLPHLCADPSLHTWDSSP